MRAEERALCEVSNSLSGGRRVQQSTGEACVFALQPAEQVASRQRVPKGSSSVPPALAQTVCGTF